MNPLIEVRGQGPDLVMVPGWGMNRLAWGPFATRLARTHRLHLVELPGHGGSSTASSPWEATFAEKLVQRLPGAAWLGWSLGGQLALRAALEHPGRIDRLVVISASARFVVGEGWAFGMPVAQFEAFRQRVEQQGAASLPYFNRLQVAGSKAARETLRELDRATRRSRPDSASLMDGLAVMARLDLSASLGSLNTPVLVISGAEDRIVDPRASRLTAERIPGADQVLIEGAGHAAFLSHPAACADAVTGFLSRERAA